MKKILILFFWLTTSLFSQQWSVKVGFGLILNPPMTASGNNVFLSCNSQTGEILATWGDSNLNPSTPIPTYSFFNGTSWSYDTLANAPFTISLTSGVASDINTVFNPMTGEFMATWADSMNLRLPTYSTYQSNAGWSAPATFGANAVAGEGEICCIYDPKSLTIFASWADTPSGEPFYAIYSNGVWSTPASISSVVVSNANVYLAGNPTTGEIMATWRTTGNIATYAVYDGSSWAAASTIASLPTVQENVNPCFDISSRQFMAVWADNSGNDNPYYTFYDPINGWSLPAPISLTSGVDTNVTVSQDTSTGEILATWLDVVSVNQSPAYSIFNGVSWSDTAFISSSATSSSADCLSCYNPVTNQFFAAWNNNSAQPSYSIYSLSNASPPAPPSQPSSFSGVQKTNGFGVVRECYNVLSWQPEPNVDSYNLYRNNTLIAKLPGSSTSYEDHDQPRKNQLYSLIAVNTEGSSQAVLLIVGAQ